MQINNASVDFLIYYRGSREASSTTARTTTWRTSTRRSWSCWASWRAQRKRPPLRRRKPRSRPARILTPSASAATFRRSIRSRSVAFRIVLVLGICTCNYNVFACTVCVIFCLREREEVGGFRNRKSSFLFIIFIFILLFILKIMYLKLHSSFFQVFFHTYTNSQKNYLDLQQNNNNNSHTTRTSYTPTRVGARNNRRQSKTNDDGWFAIKIVINYIMYIF